MTQELFNAFKSHVMALEWTDDTAELDKRLAAVSTLLYDIRQLIDDEWRAARAVRRHPDGSSYNDAEMESILAILRNQP